MSSKQEQDPPRDDPQDNDLDDMLDADDAEEEIIDEGGDVAMDSDDEGDGQGPGPDGEEIILQNDSIAFFDVPQDSLFSIAQHPLHPSLVAVGGAAGPEEDAPGAGWIFDTAAAQGRPVLPASFANNPSSAAEGAATSTELESLFSIEGHTDSVNALTWTLPRGDFLISGGLDGRIRAWRTDAKPGKPLAVSLAGEAQEVPEVNWLLPSPSADNPNTFALGSSDGSVWVYTVDATDKANPLQIVQSYFLHTMPCTAGAWTPDGKLLVTVSEDASLYVWDVWGEAAARGIVGDNGMTVVSLTADDQRFEVEGGLYSLAIDPKGTFVAAGGAGGAIKIISLPRLSAPSSSSSQSKSKGKSGGKGSSADPTTGGQILASLHSQSDSVETLAVSLASTSPATLLLAAGSVDGSICVYDATRSFAVRRHLRGAHEEHSVVKVEFVPGSWLLTSCGMDGVVRRWDLRGGGVTGNNAAGAADAGLQKEWKGHRGDGEGGGVLGFVQGQTGERVVTAGDDGIALVFEA